MIHQGLAPHQDANTARIRLSTGIEPANTATVDPSPGWAQRSTIPRADCPASCRYNTNPLKTFGCEARSRGRVGFVTVHAPLSYRNLKEIYQTEVSGEDLSDRRLEK